MRYAPTPDIVMRRKGMMETVRLVKRLARLDDVIDRQRHFLHRVPDPDTREIAEKHLLQLIDMREELREQIGSRMAA